jgi:sugar-specific transcriptional regulator TrmB
MEPRALERIGLTKGEVKIYLSLVKEGPLTKTRLAESSGVSSSKVYEIAGKLLNKGIISSYIKNHVKYYSASSPKLLKKYIEKKEKELAEEKSIVDSLIPDLEKMSSSIKDTNFEIYEGYEGMINVASIAFEILPAGSEICGIGVELEKLVMLHKYHRMRMERNIKQKMIFSNRNIKRTDYKNNEIRFIPGLSNIGLAVVGEQLIIQAFKPKPSTIIIKHPDVVSSFKNIHTELWKIAKK